MSDLRRWTKKERLLRNIVDSISEFVKSCDSSRDKTSVDARLKKEKRAMEDDEDITETDEKDEDKRKRKALQQKVEESNRKIMKDFANQYFTIKNLLQTFLSCPGVGSSSASATVMQQVPIQTMRVKLPELKLPIFRGSLMKWVTFRDTFHNLIVDNTHLSDIDRFTYLRSSLAGEALQQIASIDLTANNYSIAWNSLESRYGNKKLLVKSHLEALFAVQSMKKETFESLNHVINEFDKHLQMLDKLGEKTSEWSTILVHILSSKLDTTTLRLWETEHRSKEVPKFDKLMDFLKNHCTVLRSLIGESFGQPEQKKATRVSTSYAGVQSSCLLCGEGQHPLFQYIPNVVLSVNASKLPRSVLLATAIVVLEDQFGNTTQAMALLDSGSQLCFISEHASQRLKFKRSREALSISGIGQAVKQCKQSIFARVRSRVSTFSGDEVFHVLPRVTLNLPIRKVDSTGWKLPEDIALADPYFTEPSHVDMIIGASLFFDLLRNEKIKLGENGPVAQNTTLGWIICGNLPDHPDIRRPHVANACTEKLDELLTRFWELEACKSNSVLSLEEYACEKFFDRTTARDASGRFVVTLPKKDYLIQQLGDEAVPVSRTSAVC
ncbi:uncharacterized protein LOC134207133 [Armigeres subalbatus]|uniref:uncharacterized protein LOC134207133 n=1 Tax=Armigeres subalbatus TaxID=124917 RepID=UPI002ECFBFE4